MKPIIFAWIITLLTIALCQAGYLDNIAVSGVLRLGVIPGNKLTLYEAHDVMQTINTALTYVADYQATADIYKIGFITGGMTAFSFISKNSSGFWPFRMDYKLGVGARWKNWAAGWEHGCYHPIAPTWDRNPLPKLDVSQDFFYIKIHMGVRND
jgi:hypothetical protein